MIDKFKSLEVSLSECDQAQMVIFWGKQQSHDAFTDISVAVDI